MGHYLHVYFHKAQNSLRSITKTIFLNFFNISVEACLRRESLTMGTSLRHFFFPFSFPHDFYVHVLVLV